MLKVLFVLENTGTVLAVFPFVPENENSVLCYAHIGQHSQTSKQYYQRLRRANSEDYLLLKSELEGFGYRLSILNK